MYSRIGRHRADYARAAEAATALGYVKDPVAVPYLERAIRVNPMVDGIAIGGLERIGDASAVRALAAIINGPDDDGRDRALQARNALHAISGRTSDQQLKEEIGRALENYKERGAL